MQVPVALSTASTWPESTAAAFALAARLGYDGVELMVSGDAVSQDVTMIKQLVDYHQVPVLSIHAPCLLISQRVWGTDPWPKLVRSQITAERLGARTVVVHPPFRWQREYARDFAEGIERMHEETDVIFAVENMFPLRAVGTEIAPYAPSWSPLDGDYAHVTLDLSHTSVSRSDPLDMAKQLGNRLAHIHLADGSGSTRDEHLVPGRGNQPCEDLLGRLSNNGFRGIVVVEVNTRRATTRAEREADLAESLAFARKALRQ
jgi:sugar phosphate isomerase/epimerase